MSNRISTPFPTFNDKDGSPLDAGFIYIGAANSSPENSPIEIFYDAELTMPAENPVRTVNGYVSTNGYMRQVFCAEPIISILVQNKRKEIVWSSASINLNPGVTTDAVIDTATGESQAEINADTLRKSQNLNDLGSKEAARDNLSIYSKAQVDEKIVDASETVKGIAKLATSDIAKALTDDTTIITPKKVPDAVKAVLSATGEAPVFGCRAWVCFSGADGAIKAHGNVQSVTRNAAGDYTITFIKEMPNANYSFSANCQDSDSYGAVIISRNNTGIKTKTQLQIRTVNFNVAFDPIEVCISVIC